MKCRHITFPKIESNMTEDSKIL